MQEEVIKEISVDLVSLELVKKQLKIESDFTEDDELLQVFMDSAINQVENFIERSIAKQTTIYIQPTFKEFIFERKADNDTVEKVEYWSDENGDAVGLPTTSFSVSNMNSELRRVSFKNLPDVDVVKVAVYITQGYDESNLPSAIKQAMLLMITESYEKRENRSAVNFTTAEKLLIPYRKWKV